jgi:hypothetical protein
MTSLNYERRINLIKPFLAQFYAGFEIPREWGPERTAKDITETAELVNSEISSDVNENYLNHLLEQMAANVKKAVKSRRLTAAGILIDALNKVRSNKVPEDVAPRTTADMSFDGIEARRLMLESLSGRVWFLARWGTNWWKQRRYLRKHCLSIRETICGN